MNIAELYPRYFDEIVRFARTMVRERAAAEDVTQETFLRALRSSHVLIALSEAKARAWLYTTARRIVIDQARRQQKGIELQTDDRFEDDLSQVEVQGLLDSLADQDRAIAVMRYFQDRTSAEIGSALGMPSATVRTRLRAITKRLQALYDESERGYRP